MISHDLKFPPSTFYLVLNPWSTGSDEESDSEEKEGTTITHSNSSPAINCFGIRLGSIGFVDSVQEAAHGL